mgnify:CR=1 FL=1
MENAQHTSDRQNVPEKGYQLDNHRGESPYAWGKQLADPSITNMNVGSADHASTRNHNGREAQRPKVMPCAVTIVLLHDLICSSANSI